MVLTIIATTPNIAPMTIKARAADTETRRSAADRRRRSASRNRPTATDRAAGAAAASACRIGASRRSRRDGASRAAARCCNSVNADVVIEAPASEDVPQRRHHLARRDHRDAIDDRQCGTAAPATANVSTTNAVCRAAALQALTLRYPFASAAIDHCSPTAGQSGLLQIFGQELLIDRRLSSRPALSNSPINCRPSDIFASASLSKPPGDHSPL